jgi:hypothetical protein
LSGSFFLAFLLLMLLLLLLLFLMPMRTLGTPD